MIQLVGLSYWLILCVAAVYASSGVVDSSGEVQFLFSLPTNVKNAPTYGSEWFKYLGLFILYTVNWVSFVNTSEYYHSSFSEVSIFLFFLTPKCFSVCSALQYPQESKSDCPILGGPVKALPHSCPFMSVGINNQGYW